MPNAFSSEGVNLPLLVCRNLSNFLEAVAGRAGVTESEKFLSSICVYFKHRWTSDGSVIENSPASAGDMSSIPGSGRSPGGGNGNPLQYSCLENPTDRGEQWAAVHGGEKESDTS